MADKTIPSKDTEPKHTLTPAQIKDGMDRAHRDYLRGATDIDPYHPPKPRDTSATVAQTEPGKPSELTKIQAKIAVNPNGVKFEDLEKISRAAFDKMGAVNGTLDPASYRKHSPNTKGNEDYIKERTAPDGKMYVDEMLLAEKASLLKKQLDSGHGSQQAVNAAYEQWQQCRESHNMPTEPIYQHHKAAEEAKAKHDAAGKKPGEIPQTDAARAAAAAKHGRTDHN